ncbi:hypothetical protein [Rhodococcus sp. TAF43]|uniref:hypothetical protein n=1 Tax=Rhodococcus sp. TAF43 TaxID=3237483 RepID=UPI003F993E2F
MIENGKDDSAERVGDEARQTVAKDSRTCFDERGGTERGSEDERCGGALEKESYHSKALLSRPAAMSLCGRWVDAL